MGKMKYMLTTKIRFMVGEEKREGEQNPIEIVASKGRPKTIKKAEYNIFIMN